MDLTLPQQRWCEPCCNPRTVENPERKDERPESPYL